MRDEPGTEYGGDWHTSAVTARPGHSVSVIGSLQVCADHATLGEQTLNVVAALTAVLFWGGVLFLLWRMMVTARRNGPFTARVATAMRRLGWFIIIGSTIAAVVHLIAIDTLDNNTDAACRGSQAGPPPLIVSPFPGPRRHVGRRKGIRMRALAKKLYRRSRADRWSSLFGQVAVYSFVITAITDVFPLLVLQAEHDAGRLPRLVRASWTASR